MRNRRKYRRCKEKGLNEQGMNVEDRKDKVDRALSRLPLEAHDILNNVNVFKEETKETEPPLGPMVCSKDISLSKAELAFFDKGPRYMLLTGFSLDDLLLESKKCIVKQKFRESDDFDEPIEKEIRTEEVERIEKVIEIKKANGRMMYDEKEVEI